MLKELFSELFEKLKTESHNNSSSKSGCFNYFESHILEEKYHKVNFVSARSLTNYYNKYVEGIANAAGEPNGELKDLIAHYLGYETFINFENSKTTSSSQSSLPKDEKKKSKTISIVIITAVFAAILGGIYFLSPEVASEENCIIWKETHFEKASCRLKNTIDNRFYQLNIANFKKIEITGETIFFKNGNPMVWYGKSAKGEMEYFNLRGVHPETLKELKPITPYMINKYILDAEKNQIE